jgi:hypothetical protein
MRRASRVTTNAAMAITTAMASAPATISTSAGGCAARTDQVRRAQVREIHGHRN